MERIRVSQDIGPHIPSRPVPLGHLLVTGTSTGAAQTLHTVRVGVMLKIRKLAVANISGSATTLFLHSIPSGGSIGDSNAETKGLQIAANTAVDLTEVVGGLYEAGTVLKAYAAAGSALIIHGWGEEVI